MGRDVFRLVSEAHRIRLAHLFDRAALARVPTAVLLPPPMERRFGDPWRLQTSFSSPPASASFFSPMIFSSVNRLLHMNSS